MIPDSNSLVGVAGNIVSGMISGEGNLLLLGIILFLAMCFVMAQAKVKAGTAIMVSVCLAIMISFWVPAFRFIILLAIVVAMFMWFNGLRKQLIQQG